MAEIEKQVNQQTIRYFGYVRVSSKDQNEIRQVLAMREFGIDKGYIFVDKQSGKDFERPEYKKMLKKLRKNDVLVIKSIDRLGRNYQEIIAQWQMITRQKGAQIVVLDMPLLDTRCGKDLTGTLISDIVLQLLSYVAQMEREYIRQRQAEGIAAAKQRGVQFGAKPLPRPENFEECAEAWRNHQISAREAASRLNVCHKTFLKWVRMDDKQ